MADLVKTIDKPQLRQACASMRLGGGVDGDVRAAREKFFIVLNEIRARLRLRYDVDPLKSPIHDAILQGPKALRSACESADAPLINQSLTELMLPGHQIMNTPWAHMTPLQCCARLDLWREASVLMEFGANPNHFTAEVTAVGLAAYVGAARTLCQMIGFGANVTLYLLPEHAPNAPESHGSTLLHRVAGRAVGRNQGAVVRILAECGRCYPDPLPLTLSGKSPLDWAAEARCVEAYEQLAWVVAQREREILNQVAKPSALKPARAPRI